VGLTVPTTVMRLWVGLELNDSGTARGAMASEEDRAMLGEHSRM